MSIVCDGGSPSPSDTIGVTSEFVTRASGSSCLIAARLLLDNVRLSPAD